jgi:hypothetical protein
MTAEEFFYTLSRWEYYKGLYPGGFKEMDDNLAPYDIPISYMKEVEELMIGFAKFHVKKALEAAAKKATWKYDGPEDYLFSYADDIYINRTEILNAYPETNII